MTVFSDHLTFEPDLEAKQNLHLKLPENSHLLQRRSLNDYYCKVFFSDVGEASLLKLINEKACVSQNEFIQQNYKDDIFI